MSLKDPNVVNRQSPERVAIVISNPSVSTTTGWPVGFWWSELAHPYLHFHEKGTVSRYSARTAANARRMRSATRAIRLATRRMI